MFLLEKYINRLSTTTQIFIVIDYLILMSEKYFHFRKRQNHLAKTIFSLLVEVAGSMYFGNISRVMCFSEFLKKCKKGERNWNNLGCIKVDNFRKSVKF